MHYYKYYLNTLSYAYLSILVLKIDEWSFSVTTYFLVSKWVYEMKEGAWSIWSHQVFFPLFIAPVGGSNPMESTSNPVGQSLVLN